MNLKKKRSKTVNNGLGRGVLHFYMSYIGTYSPKGGMVFDPFGLKIHIVLPVWCEVVHVCHIALNRVYSVGQREKSESPTTELRETGGEPGHIRDIHFRYFSFKKVTSSILRGKGHFPRLGTFFPAIPNR